MRMTFRSACRNSCLAAVVYFLYVGFQKGFDVFGWYGVGWSWGDWFVLAVLVAFISLMLFSEWWLQRKHLKAKTLEHGGDSI